MAVSTAPHYQRVRLVIAGVPAGRIADVNCGVLEFTLEIDVSDDEGVARSTLEQTIKETIRQIGTRVTEEHTE